MDCKNCFAYTKQTDRFSDNCKILTSNIKDCPFFKTMEEYRTGIVKYGTGLDYSPEQYAGSMEKWRKICSERL
jgi:hypothetical protein